MRAVIFNRLKAQLLSVTLWFAFVSRLAMNRRQLDLSFALQNGTITPGIDPNPVLAGLECLLYKHQILNCS